MIGLYTVKPTTTVVQEPHKLNYAFSPSIQRLHFGVVGATCATSCVCIPSSRDSERNKRKGGGKGPDTRV